MRSTRFLALLCGLVPTMAAAQWGAGAPEERQPPPTAVAPPPPYAPVQSGVVAAPPPKTVWFLSSFNIGVPILLSTDRDVVRPGANLNARFAVTKRYVGGGVQGAFQWVPIDLDASRDRSLQGRGRDPMRRGSFGPFIHLQAPTPSGFTPYAQGGFDLNFWNYRETEFVCDFWYCYTTNVYRFTPGVHGRFGGQLGMRATSRAYLDLGVEVGMSFPGDFFIENQRWVTPYFGLGFRH